MTKAVYGLEEAPADFGEHFGKVAENLSDEFGSLGLVRLMTEPAAFQLTGVMMCKHMDDGILVGPSEALDRTSGCNGQTSPAEDQLSAVGVGDEISWETVSQDRAGISGQAAVLVLGAALLYALRV